MSGSGVAVQTVHDRLQDLAARALGLDPASPLSAADSLRVGTVAVLFLEMDTLTGRSLAGESVDLARLTQATTLLAKMIPAVPEPKVLPPEGDARAKLSELLDGVAANHEHKERLEADALRAEIGRLRAEVERLREAAVSAPPAPDAAAVPRAAPVVAPKPRMTELERLASREPVRSPPTVSNGGGDYHGGGVVSAVPVGAGWRRFDVPHGW